MSRRVGLIVILALIFTAAAGIAAEPASRGLDKAARPIAGDSSSEAHFAWMLFADAVRPLGGSLNFETWTEQCQLNPAAIGCPPAAAAAAAAKTKGGRFLHGSALARAEQPSRFTSEATQKGVECDSMQTAPLKGYPPPSNLSSSPQFCEEVFVNATEAAFVTGNSLTTLSGQKTYGSSRSNAITFPKASIEVKADWVPVSSFSNPTFQCPDPTNKLYTETINGTCYALVGLHISSKALPDWVWATFEPASSITNPNRCDPKLYNACYDPWGTTSKVPYGKGTTVPQSPQLQKLMASANLNKAFANYYLTGVQTRFVNDQGAPIPLGNSFVEFNAGVDPGQASCITCHKYAYFDGKQPKSGHPENGFGGPPDTGGWPAVGYACNQNQKGNCTPVVAGSTSQDFSWMLGLMPFQ